MAIFATFERLEIDSKLPFYGFVTSKLKRNLMIFMERVKIYRLATTRLLKYRDYPANCDIRKRCSFSYRNAI